MLNFDFSEKSLGLVSLPHFVHDFQEKCSSCCILLTDQISLSDCLYFSRCWAMCVLQLFITIVYYCSQNLKLTYLFNQVILIHD